LKCTALSVYCTANTDREPLRRLCFTGRLFVRLSVCLSVCLSDYLLATSVKTTDSALDENSVSVDRGTVLNFGCYPPGSWNF